MLYHKTRGRYYVENLSEFDINKIIELARGDKSNTHREHRDCIIVELEAGRGLAMLSNRFIRKIIEKIGFFRRPEFVFFNEILYGDWGYSEVDLFCFDSKIETMISLTGYRCRFFDSSNGSVKNLERAIERKETPGYTFNFEAFDFFNYPQRVKATGRPRGSRGNSNNRSKK